MNKDPRPTSASESIKLSTNTTLERKAEVMARQKTSGDMLNHSHSQSDMLAHSTELGSHAEAVPGNVGEQLVNSKGAGDKLPAHVKRKIGHGQAEDIHIHTDGRAAKINQALGAKAFAYGSDVYFGAGQYDPYTNEGQELLFHEIAHVIQQKNAGQSFIQRSALVETGEKGVTAKAHIYYYGGEASEAVAKAATDEINTMWNAPKGQVKFGDKNYAVNFDVKYSVVDEATAHNKANGNSSPLNNFVRIEKDKNNYNGRKSDRSWMEKNYGHWLTKDGLGTSTTAAHEFGHGFGLDHTPDNMIGKGQPGIMAARGTMVDADYTYDPKQGDSRREYDKDQDKFVKKNTINPQKRQVIQSDIDKLRDHVSADLAGVVSLGEVGNKILNAIGDEAEKKKDK